MGHYSHLSIEEREDIMVWWKNHESISQIARKLGRNKSSISREIKRNGWTIIGVAHLCYRASTAQRKTDVRRQACKKRTLLDDPSLRARIVFLICSRHFSPEQIAGRLHLELSYAPVSCSTIYRAIHSGKLDCELPGVQSVRRRLRHRGKRRHTKHLIERRGKIRITLDKKLFYIYELTLSEKIIRLSLSDEEYITKLYSHSMIEKVRGLGLHMQGAPFFECCQVLESRDLGF